MKIIFFIERKAIYLISHRQIKKMQKHSMMTMWIYRLDQISMMTKIRIRLKYQVGCCTNKKSMNNTCIRIFLSLFSIDFLYFQRWRKRSCDSRSLCTKQFKKRRCNFNVGRSSNDSTNCKQFSVETIDCSQ